MNTIFCLSSSPLSGFLAPCNNGQVAGKQCKLMGAVTSITMSPSKKGFFIGTALSNRCGVLHYVVTVV